MKTLFYSLIAALALSMSGLVKAYNHGIEGVYSSWAPNPGEAIEIKYSIIETGTSCALLFEGCTFYHPDDFLPGNWRDKLDAALAEYEAAANIKFVEVEDSGEGYNYGATSGSMIRIGGRYFDGERGTIARAIFPKPDGAPAGGDVHFDIDENWTDTQNDGDDTNFDFYSVLLHELGHAVGGIKENWDDKNSRMYGMYHERTSGLQAYEKGKLVELYGKPSNMEETTPVEDVVVVEPEPVPEPEPEVTIADIQMGTGTTDKLATYIQKDEANTRVASKFAIGAKTYILVVVE